MTVEALAGGGISVSAPAVKQCRECLTVKGLREYYHVRCMADGRDSVCKECRRTQARLKGAATRQRLKEEHEARLRAHLAATR
jgi:hypothetical protein